MKIKYNYIELKYHNRYSFKLRSEIINSNEINKDNQQANTTKGIKGLLIYYYFNPIVPQFHNIIMNNLLDTPIRY